AARLQVTGLGSRDRGLRWRKGHPGTLAARVFPVKRRERPRELRSAFDDDEVFRVGPELRRVRDLHAVSGDLAIVVRRGLERRRVLARHDPVLLVGRRQRQLREMTPVRHREYAWIEVARRYERLPALPQDEEEPGAALLLDDPLLLELVLGADHVVDRVRDRGHVLE